MSASEISPPRRELPEALLAHLRSWLGAWPPTAPPLVVGNPRNDEPAWDGVARPVHGLIDDLGRAVVGVPPALLAAALDPPFADILELERELPARLGRPDERIFRGVYRWSDTPAGPAELPDAGLWLPFDDARVPQWLRPFGGDALVALDEDGTYLAGVGIKRHDRWVHEIAVVTDERAQGRGLARRLVAQAARRIVADGAVATYLHDEGNVASAKVAAAAGFPDEDWWVLGLFVPGDSPE